MRTDAPKRFVPIAFLLLLPLITSFQNARAQADQVTFPETGKTLRAAFSPTGSKTAASHSSVFHLGRNIREEPNRRQSLRRSIP